MNRYLLNISYLGTSFRGLQKVINKSKIVPNDNTTVQGAIEIALEKLKPINEIKLILSSRTDAGVHALQSSVHVDLERKQSTPYNPTLITIGLNKYFIKNNLPIRILSTELVPDTFHCRYNVKSRTYLYRFAVNRKTELVQKGKVESTFHTQFIPIEEFDRCFFVYHCEFDENRAREAANLLKGNHDFRTFMGGGVKNPKDHAWFAYRSIYDISLEPSKPCVNSFAWSAASTEYNYWDLKVTARSFLYRQVRRMVGTILAVAQHKLTTKDVYEMLTIPSSKSWCSRAVTLPAHGLYLCKVEYDEKHKLFSDPKKEQH